VTRTLEEEEEKKMFRPFSKNYEKWLLASSCLSVCLFAWNNSAFTGRISMKFDFFFVKFFEEIQISLKSDKNNGILHEHPVHICDSI